MSACGFVYRCRLCGDVFASEFSVDGQARANNVLRNKARGRHTRFDPDVPPLTFHKCAPDRGGMADLAGFEEHVPKQPIRLVEGDHS